MPRIGKFYYKNEEKNVQLELHMEFKTGHLNGASLRNESGVKDKFFIRVPPEFEALTKEKIWEVVSTEARIQGATMRVVYGNTVDETETRMTNFLDEAYKRGAKEQRVILYRFNLNDDDKYDDEPDTTDLHLHIKWLICTKKTWGKESKYFQKKENGEIVQVINMYRYSQETVGKVMRGNDYVEILWTAESEQFFKDINKGFDGLCSKIKSVLGAQKSVMALISNKQKLLA